MSLRDELAAPSLEQAVKNYRKVVRSLIRLEASVAADNRLAVVMPKVEVYLASKLQQGLIPAISLSELGDILDEAS